ncbi:hypothetical protein D9758_005551 [Tetrapyrgos nigripes]|uniref:F-box domain-containing protein n=1 Tax=Tetrapyrgos nigripes TaxID=182062 RepID=A0A8H5LPI2_9AGAR|nr:hypothetical protein D9758_005551 [Tetrapyrgos nigripes]
MAFLNLSSRLQETDHNDGLSILLMATQISNILDSFPRQFGTYTLNGTLLITLLLLTLFLVLLLSYDVSQSLVDAKLAAKHFKQEHLPPEILALVFSFSIDESVIGTLSISCPALRLSQVCQRWRQLIRHTPSLWSTMKIAIFSDDSITTASTPTPSLHGDGLKDIMLCPAVTFQTLFPLGNASSSCKSRLEIDGSGYQESSSIPNTFQTAPVLEEVIFHGFSPSVIALPFAQLTRLTFRGIFMTDAFGCLKKASGVRHVVFTCCRNDFGFDFRDEDDPDYLDPERLQLQNLQSLSVSFGQNRALSGLLDHFTLPSLDHLFLNVTLTNDLKLSLHHKVLPSFFTRSHCNITSLSVVNLVFGDLDIITLVQALPTLRNLVIHESVVSDIPENPVLTEGFFQRMTVKHGQSSQPILLPHLKELDLQYHVGSFPESAFLEMVRSRWRPDLDAYTVESLVSLTLRPFGDEEHLENGGANLDLALQTFGAAGLCGLMPPVKRTPRVSQTVIRNGRVVRVFKYDRPGGLVY